MANISNAVRKATLIGRSLARLQLHASFLSLPVPRVNGILLPSTSDTTGGISKPQKPASICLTCK